jgi:hypothetical protein
MIITIRGAQEWLRGAWYIERHDRADRVPVLCDGTPATVAYYWIQLAFGVNQE